jgi:hypothetical protein
LALLSDRFEQFNWHNIDRTVQETWKDAQITVIYTGNALLCFSAELPAIQLHLALSYKLEHFGENFSILSNDTPDIFGISPFLSRFYELIEQFRSLRKENLRCPLPQSLRASP